ncbi:MAG: hypothetical protein QGF56_06505 [Verrucomicrobiota bacterium]|nr:hypothetical protein [Verrucomicrobiota bacterium]
MVRGQQLKRLENCAHWGDSSRAMPCVILMEVKVIPEKLDDCIKLLVENRLEDTKAYDGCETCYGSVDKEKSIVTLWTQWSTVEHWEKYFAWRKERGDFTEFSSFFSEEPKISTSEVFY